MNIIRRGTPPSERIFRGTCMSCKTIAEAKRSELKIIHQGDQREPGESADVKCPVCGATMWLYHHRG